MNKTLVKDYDNLSKEDCKHIGLFSVSLLDKNDNTVDAELENCINCYSVNEFDHLFNLNVNLSDAYRPNPNYEENSKLSFLKNLGPFEYSKLHELRDVLNKVVKITVTYYNRYGDPIYQDKYLGVSLWRILDTVNYIRTIDKMIEFNYTLIEEN